MVRKTLLMLFLAMAAAWAIEIDLEPRHKLYGKHLHLKAGQIHKDKVGVKLLKGNLPFVNRPVRFVSFNTNILVFLDSISTNATNKRYITNVDKKLYTDNDGNAFSDILLLKEGTAHVLIQEFSPRRTNRVLHQEIVTVEAYIPPQSKPVSLTKPTLQLTMIYLLVIVISGFLVSHFKRLKKNGEKPSIARRTMATLFGLSSVKNNEHISLIIVLIEMLLVLFLLNPSYVMMITMFLSLLAMAAYSIRTDRGFAFFFLFFALIGALNYYGANIFGNILYKAGYVKSLMVNPFVIFAFFFIVSAFLNGSYFPILLLILYCSLLSPGQTVILSALGGIFFAFLLYFILVKFKIRRFIFYKLNFLKIKE